MRKPTNALATLIAATLTALLVPAEPARADDLVAAVLPLSRSPQIGQTAAAFATVINTSGHAFDGCTVSLPNFAGSFGFQTTDPATNGLTGTRNQPFNLTASGAGSVQTVAVFLQPSAALPPTNELFVFQCSGSAPAASIIGVDTLLLSAGATATPDVVALVATPSGDGVVRLPGIGSPQAFALATVNVGSAGTITVSADTGDIKLPLETLICQTNPATGQCLSPPSSTVSISFSASGTPTFSVFTTAMAAVPFFPADVRLFLRFNDSGAVLRGSTSVALSTASTLAPGQTAGGLYAGIYRVTSGTNLGLYGTAGMLIAEDGEMVGITLDTATGKISALFNGQAMLTNTLLYASTGTIFAGKNFPLPGGASLSPITIAGAGSPRNFLAGLYSLTGETGEYYLAYQASSYEQPSALSLIAGNWTLRNGKGAAIGSLVVNPSGGFSGTDSSGCIYSGTISIVDPSYNAYHLSLTLSSCSQNAGSYSGLGYLFTQQTTNDTFRLLLASSQNAEAGDMTRY